jgi:DNA processing protein
VGAERARAEAAGVRILGWGDRDYPAALRELADPPPAVFLRGRLLECDRNAVAVVGARRATPYGLRTARTLSADLARAGVTVVGGLARGIDTAGHAGALDADGRTVAVLGSGLLVPYPEDNVPLMERAARSGAVLSEFPLHAPPARANFPRRNRLVAALSLAVLVVEAGPRSGAHSTVRHALDCGRTVMAVPGPVDSDLSRGTLALLQEGAAPVGSVADVFAALGWCTIAKSDLPDAERRVLEALGEEGATVSEVARAVDLREEVAAGYLVTLEVRGLATREAGSRYVAR